MSGNRKLGRAAVAAARAGMLVLLGGTVAHASDALLNGFFSANPSGCFNGTGVLYVCKDKQCTSRTYKDTGALSPMTVSTDTIIAKAGGTSSNGIVREAGDITLRYQSYGADYLKIVRPAGQMLVTTYLAKTDRQGQIVLPLIADKQAKDPSAKSEALSRCLNYEEHLEEISGLPDEITKIETYVAPGLPLEFAYTDAKASEGAGPIDVPVYFSAPKKDAYIGEVVPLPHTGPDYPDLMVLWTISPGLPVPIQVLAYDPKLAAYIDTSQDAFVGDRPFTDGPHDVALGAFVDGRPSVYILNGGQDNRKATGAIDNLLVLNGEGKLEDYGRLLTQRRGWGEGLSAGVVGPNGEIGIYAAKIHSAQDGPTQYRQVTSDGLADRSKWVPKNFRYDGLAALVDVNQDQLADLMTGSKKGLLFLNPGDGNFSKGEKIALPKPSVPSAWSPVTKSTERPAIASISGISTEQSTGNDLLMVSTPFYKGYSLQYLKNDGSGNFRDETATYFPGAETVYVSKSEANYVWMRRAWAFEAENGVPDIIARSASGFEIPSRVFLNEGGIFHEALSVSGHDIVNVMHMAGKPVLILSNSQTVSFLAYPSLRAED
ncbi:hypothetical protein ASC89_24945 [Devosia sp. Root413D1]|nr:hypothetical protein ASC89_24945 [Devosia sp. Root413D1]